MKSPILEVKNLSKKFHSFTAVDSISFSIYPGEIVGLLGPNGAGKTTTLQMLLSLMNSSHGEIAYFGLSLKDHRETILQRVNLVNGQGRIPYRLKVKEFLKVFAELYSVKNPRQKIDALVQKFEAENLMNKSGIQLSSGELVRILFVKAFLNDPDIILLDEPTTGLDPYFAEKIWDFIIEEKKNRPLTILLTSHNMKEVENLCDRIIMMDQGKILEINTPKALARKIVISQLKLMIEEKAAFLNLLKYYQYSYTESDSIFTITLPTTAISDFLKDIISKNINFKEIEVIYPTLEEYFLSIAQRKKSR
jgi:ABC-2 type transport system ATP-binding protein